MFFQEEGKLSINRTFARAFINYVTMAIDLEMNPVFFDNEEVKNRYQLMTDAQLSVLSDLAALVSNETEVFVEYDRMLSGLQKAAPESVMALALEAGRETLKKLIVSQKTH